MNKQNAKAVQLGKGLVEVYSSGVFKLHAYQTNDLISDTVFLIEKDGKMLIVEQPCFFDNIKELAGYISSKEAKAEAKILPYHIAGGSFLPEVRVYTTAKAKDYGYAGGGKALIDNFTQAFGAIFDPSVSKITDIIKEGKNTIGGISVNLIATAEAFDIEFPEINAVYTHMLGADTHSIIGGKEHADALILYLKGIVSKKYDLILSSHHMPETLKDVEVKISYIEALKQIADKCADAGTFKTEAKKKFPGYQGENYLDMTAGFFFPAQ